MHKKILIIDNDIESITKIRRVITKSGYAYEYLQTTENILKRLGTEIFDLILLKIDMPDTDGVSVLKSIKSHPVFYDIPVIMIANEIDGNVFETCYSFGADDLIVKPIEEIMLSLRIKSSFEKQSFIIQIQMQKDELKMKRKSEKETNDRVKKIMEAVQAGIVLIDPKTRNLIDANSAALKMFGKNINKICSKECNPDFQNKNPESQCPVIALNSPYYNKETVLLNAENKQSHMLKTAVPVKIKGKQFVLESFVDFSSQKMKEEKLKLQKEELESQRNELEKQRAIAIEKTEELRVKENRLQAIIETSLSGIALTNIKGEFTFVNNIFPKLFGYSKDEFLKMSIFQIVPLKDLQEVNMNYTKLILGETKYNEEIRLYQKRDKSKFWGHITISAIQNNKRKPENFVCMLTDINQLKRNEIEIAAKNKHINDGIIYAKRIQNALFPTKDFVRQLFPEHFIIYKPKEIVSGDFFWVKQTNEFTIIAVADCTGHGVPGAFMSLLFISMLNKIVAEKDIIKAGQILDALRDQLKSALTQSGQEKAIQDGMDIAICVFDSKNKLLQFAGAYNPLYFFREGKLHEIKGDPMPIGLWRKDKNFSTQEFTVQKDDVFYMFTDGFYDQTGGPYNKKFMKGKFRELIRKIHKYPFKEQNAFLEKAFDNWKMDHSQIDDVLLIGFKWHFRKFIDDFNEMYDWESVNILIAEDNDRNYLLIENYLKETKAKLIRAKNGLQAVEICKLNKDINIVLMDILMPVMDGIEALSLIKKESADLPVIVQTALIQSTEKARSFRAGCDDYISKPINKKELLATISKFV